MILKHFGPRIALAGILMVPWSWSWAQQPAPANTAPVPTAPPPVAPVASAVEKPRIVPEDRFEVPEGLELTVWATTPMLRNPTNIDFDAEGRLYVAEGVNYRSHSGRDKKGDRIVVLEDTDKDGKADATHTFLQDETFVAPLGVAVFGNQVVVSQPPELLVFTDINRDGEFEEGVDKKTVLLKGFNGKNHDHSLHSVTAGPDGLWYWNQGNTGALFKDKGGKTFRIGSPYLAGKDAGFIDPGTVAGQKSDDGRVYVGGFAARMQPDGSEVAIIGHNFRNSFEQAVTSYGDVFQSDNDDPPACRVTPVLEGGNAGFASADGQRSWQADRRPGQSVPVAEWRQEDPGTMPAGDIYGGGSPTGVAFYENGALGEKFEGLLLACEAGRNVIFGYYPKPEGAGFKMERFDFVTSNKERRFAGSDFLGGGNSVNNELTTLFRPSDVAVGPDGTLYIADWFDPRVGGHSDLDDTTTGTIYRLAPKGFKPQVPKLDLSTTEGQIAALRSPAVNVRHSGFLALKAQGEPAVEAVSALLNEKNTYLVARAVFLLAQMGEKGLAKVTPLLDDRDAQKRVVAVRALRRAKQDVATLAARMAKDTSAAVRREVAHAVRALPLPQALPLLVDLGRQFDGADRAYLEAWGLAAEGREREVYRALFAEVKDATKWTDAQAWLAWRLHVPEAVAALSSRVSASELSVAQRKLALDSLAFIKSPYAALAMVDLAASPAFALKEPATWWLFNRKNNLWQHYGVEDAMSERGLYDPASIQLTSMVSPDPSPEPTKLRSAEILKLAGDPNRGAAAAAVCTACHRIGQQGSELGPDLTMFGKTQTREVILNAIISPSADIAHGFDAQRLVTKDGLTIDGLVVSKEDPVMIRSIGAVMQTVPRARIKSLRPLGRSLMFTADMMGLNEQTLADLVAYLQSEIK